MDAIAAQDDHDRGDHLPPSDTADPGTALLQAWHIWLIKQQGNTERHLLSNCSLTIYPGEMIAIEGGPQSGRAEFMSILAGFETPTRGTVLFESGPLIDPFDDAQAARRRRQLGHLFAAGMLLPGMSAAANVRVVLEGLHRPGQTDEHVASEVTEALHRSGFDGDPAAPVSTLERPQRIRVGLATSLVKRPKILLCDAPAEGLSEQDAEALFDQFEVLRRTEGMAVALATANPEYAARAERHYRLEQGHLKNVKSKPRASGAPS
jgi:putative ABC transport system ATP-binding protein